MQDTGVLKASEEALAYYLTQISSALHKECGDRPYTNKTGDTTATDSFYQS